MKPFKAEGKFTLLWLLFFEPLLVQGIFGISLWDTLKRKPQVFQYVDSCIGPCHCFPFSRVVGDLIILPGPQCCFVILEGTLLLHAGHLGSSSHPSTSLLRLPIKSSILNPLRNLLGFNEI